MVCRCRDRLVGIYLFLEVCMHRLGMQVINEVADGFELFRCRRSGRLVFYFLAVIV